MCARTRAQGRGGRRRDDTFSFRSSFYFCFLLLPRQPFLRRASFDPSSSRSPSGTRLSPVPLLTSLRSHVKRVYYRVHVHTTRASVNKLKVKNNKKRCGHPPATWSDGKTPIFAYKRRRTYGPGTFGHIANCRCFVRET